MDYKFYIAKKEKGQTIYGDYVSIEDYFDGVKYKSCEGLDDVGEPKNIYTETYAESETIRVWLPDEVVFENTDIEFEFLFVGDDCHDKYMEFRDYVSNCFVKYYDTYRNLEVEMILTNSTSPSEIRLYGEDKYILASFKFKNIGGKAKKKE